MAFNQTLFKRGQGRGRPFTKKPGTKLISLKTKKKQFEVNVFNIALHTLIQQTRDRFQAAEKTMNRFLFLWLSESKSRQSEEKINPPSLEEKCKTLVQIYVKNVDEKKLIGEVRHLDTLKYANLFGPKELLTSIKLLNRIRKVYSISSNHYAFSTQFLFPSPKDSGLSVSLV